LLSIKYFDDFSFHLEWLLMLIIFGLTMLLFDTFSCTHLMCCFAFFVAVLKLPLLQSLYCLFAILNELHLDMNSIGFALRMVTW
jgi:hypothetical protein